MNQTSGLSDKNRDASKFPADPFANRWYIFSKNKAHGPYTGHQIKKIVEEGNFPGIQLVFPELQPNSGWRPIAKDPILGALFFQKEFKNIGNNSSINRNRTKTARYRILLVGLMLIGWLIWPYYAAYELAAAFRSGDVSTLERRVKWENLRLGLRGDLNAALLEQANSEASTEALGAGLSAMLGPLVVDRLVESFVTPQSLALAAQGQIDKAKATDASSSKNTFNEKIKAAQDVRWSDIKYAFFSGGPFTFLVKYDPTFEFDGVLTLKFEWDGTWRLVRVYFPRQEIGNFASRSREIKNIGLSPGLFDLDSRSPDPVESAKETNSPKKIEVSLIEKSFKPLDLSANRYQDFITIKLKVDNVAGKSVRAFDGIVKFTDLLGNEVFKSKIAINELINKGSSISWSGTIEYNQFMDEHQRMRSAKQENLLVTFYPRKILYADGTSEKSQ